jgi:general secretion pathway protein A
VSPDGDAAHEASAHAPAWRRRCAGEDALSYFRLLGLDTEPFSTSPDPAFLYQSSQYREALANLIIEFRLKRGLSVLLGDIGVGKTTLGRKLVQLLRERTGFVFHMVLDPTYPTEELFFHDLVRTLQIELATPTPNLVDYREAIERFLFRKGVQERQTVVLIIDEAHKLNPLSLEALRILLNYETNEFKLLQLVLLGQMELLPILMGLPNVVDRISLKCTLNPLNLDETRELIEFRLQAAGYRSRAPLFDAGAIMAIHDYTQGYPRRIAMLCHQSLRHLTAHQGRMVDLPMVEELISREIESGWSLSRSPRKLQQSSF